MAGSRKAAVLTVMFLAMPVLLTASTNSNEVYSPDLPHQAPVTEDKNAYANPNVDSLSSSSSYNSVSNLTSSSLARRGRRRSRRCKCLKRYTKEVNQMIDQRLEDFERRYLLHLNGERERVLGARNEASSTASRIQGMDKLLVKLNADVVQTKEAIHFLNVNLDSARQQLNRSTGDMHVMNASLGRLDSAMDDLRRVVSRVEHMIPTGMMSHPLIADAELDDNAPKTSYPRNCEEVYQQGGMQFQGDYYIMIKPDGVARPFKALCKMFNNSGWTVIQKRQDGSVDFFRSWQEYRKGFGSLEGEFWLGNDYIHHLAMQEPTMLRIEMRDWEGQDYHAVYDSFRIDDEKGLYRLHIGNYHGDAGDSLRSHWENHDGMPFSTKDRDNDGRYYDSCAEHFHGAWWFNNCFDSHLNGKYYHKGFHKNYFQRDGIQWNTIHMYSSLKSVHMMLKPAPLPLTPQPPTKVKGKKRKGRSKGRARAAEDRRRV